VSEIYNIYCDESCHLENDGISVMALGAVWCRANRTQDISKRINEITQKHGIPSGIEIKWSKLSPSKRDLYLDLIDYFFIEAGLHFRGILIPNKDKLNHDKFNQTHNSWYYKMCFRMIEPIINPTFQYRIYLDIKDTQSELTRIELE